MAKAEDRVQKAEAATEQAADETAQDNARDELEAAKDALKALRPTCVPFRSEASGLWPDTATRIKAACSNSLGVATYFHEQVKLYLDAFFQFPLSNARGHKSSRQGEGLFGLVEAYAGTVETQRRGSLHLHILLWLVSLRSLPFSPFHSTLPQSPPRINRPCHL